MRLTIVIPTFNEAENLPKIVSALFALPLEELSILVVDDNSPDGTGKIAEDIAGQYPGRISAIHRAGKLGLGTAYLTGFKKAIENGAEAVGQMDADFSHPPEAILKMMQVLQTSDAVSGSRYVSGGSLDKQWPLWRKGLSAFANFYARTILGVPTRDVTGGFRMWRKETLQGMPLERVRSNGYAFQVEVTYLAHLCGYKIQEIPIYFADRRWGQSKMSFRIQREAAIRVWQILWGYRDLRRSRPTPKRSQ